MLNSLGVLRPSGFAMNKVRVPERSNFMQRGIQVTSHICLGCLWSAVVQMDSNRVCCLL